ncbi:kinase-like protein [Aspergillus sclerotioniger CBS 115572]|uniref:Kinase-like protein n=1 Tax=Aspergillus sclerotioniger CBS 115572 TaxID=1450535 RepID=A0A317X644_9EURO|nr:kinase-like protein [Aspergillus sclerotioniger CBS 115572]PWY94064.1 kinase-like protein [Aspergillus sclerotioniger CBS 115572]
MGATGNFSFPPGIGLQDVKGCGTSGMAALDPNTKYIIKFSLGDEDECARCNREKEFYELLELSSHSRPSSLLNYHGSTSHGILLEYAELGPVRQVLRASQHPISTSTLVRWAQQAVEALQFIHANEICHGDINCTNFFLDQHMNLKVGDFTSSFNDLFVTPQALQEDISNYGSALYEMATGHLPYHTLSGDEREQRFKQKRFPDLANVALKSVILRSWNAEHTSFASILKDIKVTCIHPHSKENHVAMLI